MLVAILIINASVKLSSLKIGMPPIFRFSPSSSMVWAEIRAFWDMLLFIMWLTATNEMKNSAVIATSEMTTASKGFVISKRRLPGVLWTDIILLGMV